MRSHKTSHYLKDALLALLLVIVMLTVTVIFLVNE